MINKREMIIILFVKDQLMSKEFYVNLLGVEPVIDVAGMTEITLTETSRIGLIPSDGIVNILDGKVKNPNLSTDIPRCELYLYVDNPDLYLNKAHHLGGNIISPGEVRNWGDYVAYCSDFDGNIIAFAKKQ